MSGFPFHFFLSRFSFYVEVVGAGDKGLGDTRMVDIEELLEAFLEEFQTWVYFSQLLK